jgi:hypothetical protein
MLTLFEDVTHNLTGAELEIIVPKLITAISERNTKQKAIKNKDLVKWLKSENIQTSEVRIRMMVNFIRNTNRLYCLIGTANGYFVSKEIPIIDDQIESILGRINSMKQVIESLQAQKQHLIIEKNTSK